jgi:hypothetical protein
MGNLITELPVSEMNATIELFDRLGVDREGLKRFRKASSYEQMTVAGMIQNGISEVQATKLAPAVAKILELVSTVVVRATTSKFVAKDKFVVNTKRNANVKIPAVWENFTTWFLSDEGLTEDPITETTLRYHKLRKSSVDGPIITELGGEAKAETTLSEMFSLMAGQKNGEDGVLLNNGYANIFYIKDQKGVLRTVYVFWYDGGWFVNASSVESPDRWYDGSLVFSRNSVLDPSATVSAQA